MRSLGLALGLLTAGCATSIRPPADPVDPVEVAVVDYGYHASLVLPGGPESGVEYAYGEWEWFARNNDAWYRVFPALFWPTTGALGRRNLAFPPTIPAEEILVFKVGRAEADALRARLDKRWTSRPETPLFNPLVGLSFVPDEDAYCMAWTCNSALQAWLRELGCDVSGSALRASFRVVP